MIRWGIARVVICCMTYTLICVDKVSLNNMTDHDVYAALYADTGIRSDEPIKIPALGTVVVDKPYVPFLSGLTYGVRGALNADDLVSKHDAPRHDFSLYSAMITDSNVKNVSLQSLGNTIGASADDRSGSISLKNKTEEEIFIALYYDDGHEAVRWGSVVLLKPHSAVAIMRPERKCRFKKIGQCIEFFDRNVYIARSQDDLVPIMKSYNMPHVNVGELKGTEFFIYFNDKGALAGTNGTNWQLISSKKTLVSLVNPDVEAVKKKFEALDYPGKGKVASVRRDNNLSSQEQEFRALREKKYVRPLCVELLKKEYNIVLPDTAKIPTIGLAVSGGGCRAMLIAAGFIAAAEEEGLLPLLTYIATLSGSTWFLAGWLASGVSAQEYHRHILNQLTDGLMGNLDMHHIVESALKAKAFGQDVSVINIYGALLGDKLLRHYAPRRNPNYVMYGEVSPRITHAEVPYPLYTAVTPRQFSDLVVSDMPVDYYYWLTFDPYEVAIPALKAAIPSYAFGRTFHNDIAQVSIPPIELGNLMGIWGSAMSLNTRDAASVIVGSASPEVANDINTLLSQNKTLQWLVQQRTSPAKIPNFAGTGMMTVVDGGMSLIIPVPPLVQPERHVDIMIALDAGAAIKYAPGPRGINQYVQKNNIAFPEFDLAVVGKRPYTVAWDMMKPAAPAVLYVPMLAHKGYQNNWDPEGQMFSNTFNFTYTREQATLLSGLGAYMFRQIRPILIDMLREWVQKANATKLAERDSANEIDKT